MWYTFSTKLNGISSNEIQIRAWKFLKRVTLQLKRHLWSTMGYFLYICVTRLIFQLLRIPRYGVQSRQLRINIRNWISQRCDTTGRYRRKIDRCHESILVWILLYANRFGPPRGWNDTRNTCARAVVKLCRCIRRNRWLRYLRVSAREIIRGDSISDNIGRRGPNLGGTR